MVIIIKFFGLIFTLPYAINYKTYQTDPIFPRNHDLIL